jgi:hypothetical protein
MYETLPYCQCGCGEQVKLNKKTGKANRYAAPGHAGHLTRKVDYIVEDRGHTTPCWIWNRSKTSKGYGQVTQKGSKTRLYAHRVYYEQHVGPIPDGLFIDHLCREHACVNPAHMEPVTNRENLRRGRSTKIDVQVAQQIREATGTQREIAAQFGISHPTVNRIRNGVSWAPADP